MFSATISTSQANERTDAAHAAKASRQELEQEREKSNEQDDEQVRVSEGGSSEQVRAPVPGVDLCQGKGSDQTGNVWCGVVLWYVGDRGDDSWPDERSVSLDPGEKSATLALALRGLVLPVRGGRRGRRIT